MTDTAQAQESTSSPFGWPLEKRRDYFGGAPDAGATHRVVFTGQNMDLPILRVPISLPKYRLDNGRTASAQEEYLARNLGTERDFFVSDPERIDVQTAQHALLSAVINQSGLRKKFEDVAVSQVEPIVLDSNGYVINGNRRLCTWRILFQDDPAKWARYSHIDVVVLPKSDDLAIDQLEALLQIDKDVRADYAWEAKAVMMKRRREAHNLSDEKLAALYGQKVSEIRKQLAMLDAAAEYLRSRGKADMWSLVSDNELAFSKFVEGRGALPDVDSKALFKETAYALIDNPSEAGDRLYEVIPAVNKYLDFIKVGLLEQFPIVEPAETLDDPFGDGTPVADGFLLAAEIAKPENSKAVRAVVKEVIEARKSAQRDEQSAQYLFNMVKRANAAMSTAVSSAIGETADSAGVAEQLDAIEAHIATLRAWLDAAH